MAQVATLSIKKRIYIDDVETDEDFFNAIAEENAATFDDFREHVSVRVYAWDLHIKGEENPRTFATFEDFRKGLHALNVRACYVYDGADVFSAIEWEMHGDKLRTWQRTSKEERRDADGHYTKVTGFCYAELSGDLGQRYSFDLWSVDKDKKGRDVTRGTHFFAFKNVFMKGFENTLKAFNVANDNREDCTKLLSVLEKFDIICMKYFSLPYMGEKKPLALTCGSLARIALFAEMYGRETIKKNDNAFKKAHRGSDEEKAFLRRCKLMRGGICVFNPQAIGKRLLPVDDVHLIKYDFNSEYSSIACDLPDLRDLYVCDAGEVFNRYKDYEYIIIFDAFFMRVKRGMPCVFTHPWTGKNTQEITILQDFAIYAEELDELQNFYTLGECHIKYVCKAKREKNEGIKRFAEKWYNLKEKARTGENDGFFAFAKLINNGAWGQLAKKSVFPVVSHVYDENTRLFRLHIELKEGDADGCKYSLLMGALITARARIKTMQAIRAICGNRNALETFVYTDTDSVAAYATAPAGMVGRALGQLKEEVKAVESKYLGKKIYYNIKSLSPLSIDLHARGISKDAIINTLLDNYGVDKLEELPAEAFADIFNVDTSITTPAYMQVRGGRVKMYVRKYITVDGIRVMSARNSRFFVDADGGISEL